jgi:hypothetical protein
MHKTIVKFYLLLLYLLYLFGHSAEAALWGRAGLILGKRQYVF